MSWGQGRSGGVWLQSKLPLDYAREKEHAALVAVLTEGAAGWGSWRLCCCADRCSLRSCRSVHLVLRPAGPPRP